MVVVKMLPITVNVPDDLTAAVGRIVVHWSFEMWLLAKITHTILGVGTKEGRVAVRDPRAEDYIAMIEQLMELKSLTTSVDLGSLREDLRELKSLRDGVAHGVWNYSEEKHRYSIQFTSGTWKPDPKQAKRARRITPEAKVATVEGLETVRAGIADAITRTQSLHREIETQIASRDRRPPQSHESSPPPDPKSGTRQRQRRA